MVTILSIDTSTNIGSVALHVEGRLCLYHESFIEKSHSENLVKQIGNILEEAGLKPDQVDAVAVSKGPGSYTGLRIGVSVAKGFCYAHNIHLISVDTLLSMASEVKTSGISGDYYCPMIDARRMEVYCALYDKDLNVIQGADAIIVDEDKFSKYTESNRVLFFGNGSTKCKEIFSHDNTVFLENIYPKAKHIGYLAVDKLTRGDFENLAYFEPYYLKEFIAKKPSGRNLV